MELAVSCAELFWAGQLKSFSRMGKFGTPVSFLGGVMKVNSGQLIIRNYL